MQAKRARAEHDVICSLMLDKRRPTRRPLTELCINGSSTEDRRAWEPEVQRHCAEVYVDTEDTIDEQEKRILRHTEDGNHD